MEPKKKSTSEVGHIKNLNNYERFILYCGNELQPKYNPVKKRITVVGMQTHHQKATDAYQTVRQTREELGVAVNFRQELMDDIKIRATSMQGSLIGATEDDKIVEDFAGVNKKIQGKLSIPKTNDDQPGQELMRAVSNSQQSIGQLIDNFETAVKILELVPDYTPNEPELTVTELYHYVKEMKAAQIEVEIKFNAYSKALDIRDELFYAPKYGIVDNVDEAKNYIIGVFKFNSPEYRHVRAIHFRNFRRKNK